MLTPGEVIAANNTSGAPNRVFGENNNVEFHIHAILGPLQGQTSKHWWGIIVRLKVKILQQIQIQPLEFKIILQGLL